MNRIITIIIILFLASSTKAEAQCVPNFTPDLTLIPSTPSIQAEIDAIYNTAKNTQLASSQPSAVDLNNAITAYNNLGITATSTTISGNPISSYNDVSFIGVFVDYLNFNPTDSNIIEKVNNTVWWTYHNLCNNTLSVDYNGYVFRNFSRKGFFCIDYLTTENKERILYIIEKEFGDWSVFWKSNYDYNSQLTDGAINTDHIFNKLDALVPIVKYFSSNNEQYRYMRTLSRFVSRFSSTYTNGTHDGLKPDGSGYHHWNNYEAYMYAYNNIIYMLKLFNNTSFQINTTEYLVFRDAIIHKLLKTNDDGFLPLCMTGRSANWETITLSQTSLKKLANLGGNILGLTSADPVLAGIYNRRFGIDASFNYTTIAPFYEGFYQNNHASTGIYRINNTLLISRGFNNVLWGSEIYPTSNRYGRYQAYGTLSVVYPGNRNTNGFDNTKWDWNYNPGTTTKVLDWDKLIAAWNRLDEYSNKRFSGSLQFDLQNNGFLDKVFGTYGMFAMDFQEKTNLGFGGVTAPDTHDPSFTFKKSNFFFDDMIICLGSNINNNDVLNNTVTTLYQNVTNPSDVIVNNSTYNLTGVTTTYPETLDNWVLDNLGTGFYIVNQSGDLKIQRKNQTTPSHNQNNPSILNSTSQAAIGYIDHGVSPLNKGYEYVVVPNTNTSNMQSLANLFSSPTTKPYELINKDNKSHIIKHKLSGIYAFALFDSNTSISGNTNLVSNDIPCLIMYQKNSINTEMKLSLSNPDLGLPNKKSYDQYTTQDIQITLDGVWQLIQAHPDISLVSSNSSTSTFSFSTYQGLPIEATFQKENALSISNLDSIENSILIYPNPTEEVLHVENIELNSSNTILYNLLGQDYSDLIDIDNNTINMSNLPAGTYILKIKTFANIVYKK